jgi:aspartyl-tRNA(Asn)/glutamyl-tRNA(Gln) amidotransferase subunit C
VPAGSEGSILTIDEAEVRRIARLAHLDLDPGEVEALRGQLGSILAWVGLLDGLPEVVREPLQVEAEQDDPHGVATARPDEPAPSLPVAQALRGAPGTAAGCFSVPRMLAE